ncbi:MAG: hypothetical protein WBW81_14825 [Methylocella sp.]
MKLVTAISVAALVLGPAVALAQAPANGAGDTQEDTLKSKVGNVIEKMTGRSPDTKEDADAKSGAAAANPGNTNYPDRSAVKRTDK